MTSSSTKPVKAAKADKPAKAAKLVGITAADAPEQVICGDPMRMMFYQRISRYFENETMPIKGAGTCGLCGKDLPRGVADAQKQPVCRPQRAISQNRTRPKEGSPVAFGSPIKEGSAKNSLNGLGGISLIATDRTFVACNVMPTMPLPPEMTAVPMISGVQGKFLKDFMQNPPKPPFLLVLWNRKSTGPLVMTETLTRIYICGEDTPLTIDIREVRAAMNLIERLGDKLYKSACWLRYRIGQETNPDKLMDLNEELRSLRLDHGNRGITMTEFNTLPKSDSVVLRMALQAMGSEQPAADVAAEDEAEAA